MFVSETYALEDCMDYQPMTSNAHQSRWNIPSEVTSASIFGYSSDGWKFGNASIYSRIKHNISLTSPFSAEFTVTAFGNSTSNPAPVVYFYTGGTTTPNAGFAFYSNQIDFNNSQVINRGGVTGAVYKVEFSTSTVKLYENGTLIYTGSHSVSLPTQFEFHTGASRYCVVKDFKIKPL